MLDDAPETWVLGGDQDSRKLAGMFGISAIGHLVFFIMMMIIPTSLPSSYRLAPQAISVDLVSLPAGEAGPAPAAPEAPPEPEPAPEPPAAEAVPVPEPQPQPEPEPETISVAPKPEPEKVVKSLKKKTLKKETVAKTEVEQPAPQPEIQKPATPQPPSRDRQLNQALESMRQKVARQEKTRGPSVGSTSGGGAGGGGGGGGGAAVLSRIQNYRIEAAIAVSQNWAFSQQLAGADGELETRLTFRILPNGEITDIQIVQPSGNRYLDESAYRAVRKASPVAPHPEGLNQPYIEVGVKATPSGFR